MPLFTLLRHAPPAPAITLRSPFKVHSSPRPFTCPSLRPAAPLRRDLGAGISSIGCRAAADASSSEFPAAGDGDSAPWGLILRAGEVLSLGFPVWVASACALALWRPPAFLWVGPTARMVGLSFTMLGPCHPPLVHCFFHFFKRTEALPGVGAL
jgi:bile acid:Na+ symporter, BASS family